MEFGVVGLEGLVGGENISSGFCSDRGTKQERYGGSGILKQERSDNVEDDDWRSSKVSKTEPMLLPQRNTLLKSNNNTSCSSLFPYAQQQQQMLSFSSPKSEPQNHLTLPGFHLFSYAHNRSTGGSYESMNGSGNMHGLYTETRGPFTPSQWMELEHQALIYKYITANVPIPSNLLSPIRRALDSSAISSYSGALLRPNALSWGGFHLGFSSNSDPEPGRCRRTDGKKWRCSRDAVADQKYCERHMNRGRHRSRKHVEGQSGHSSSAAAATSSITSKPMSSASSAAVGLHGSSASKSVAIAQSQHQQLKNLQSDTSSNLSAASSLNRMFLSKENMGEKVEDSPGVCTLSSKINVKAKENPFMILKQHSTYQESSQLEFGRVNSDSLLNPSSSVITCRNFESSNDLSDQQTIQQNSIRQFMDDWPRSQSDQTDGLWPHVHTDRTQLSISIPVAPTDFMSSTSSPNNDKSALSPLRLSCDLDLNAFNQRQTNWIPVPWETSMGGPLGEVLHSGSECKSSSVLPHLKEGWDSSPRLGSSPTGVLQKPTFGSLSNSSAGSSPRADRHRTNEGASLCCDFLA
ncbi:Growth-regulating factor 6 [Euphorbia peplus]|nr:Growth-regulating factor 6 [Euphorbia peplus]